MASKKRKEEIVVNPFSKNVSNIGRRTGKNVLEGKNIRKDEHGLENFDDYWSDQSESADSYADWIQKRESQLSTDVSEKYAEVSPNPSLTPMSSQDESCPQDGDETLLIKAGLLQGGNSDGSITSHTESKTSHLDPPSVLKNFTTKKRLRYSAVAEKKLEEAEENEETKEIKSGKKKGSAKCPTEIEMETPSLQNKTCRSLRSSSKKPTDINQNTKEPGMSNNEDEKCDEPATTKNADTESKSRLSPDKELPITEEHNIDQKDQIEQERLRKIWNEDGQCQPPIEGNTVIIETNQNETVDIAAPIVMGSHETVNQNNTVTIAVSGEDIDHVAVENLENKQRTPNVIGTVSYIEDKPAEDSDDFELQSIDESQKFVVESVTTKALQSRRKSYKRTKDTLTPYVNDSKKTKKETTPRSARSNKKGEKSKLNVNNTNGKKSKKDTESKLTRSSKKSEMKNSKTKRQSNAKEARNEILSSENEGSDHSGTELLRRKVTKADLKLSLQEQKVRKRHLTNDRKTKKDVTLGSVQKRSIQQKSTKKSDTKKNKTKNLNRSSEFLQANSSFENRDPNDFNNEDLHQDISLQDDNYHNVLPKRKQFKNQSLVENSTHIDDRSSSENESLDSHSVHTSSPSLKRKQKTMNRNKTVTHSRLKSTKSTRKISLSTPISTIRPKQVGRKKKVFQLEETPISVAESPEGKKRKKKRKSSVEREESPQRSDITEFGNQLLSSTSGDTSSMPVHYHQISHGKSSMTLNQTKYMEMPTVIQHPKKLISPKAQATPGVRRSKRIRSAPLEWFRNERLQYKKSKDGDWNIVGLLSPKNKELRKEKASKKKPGRAKKKKRLSAPRNQSLHVGIDNAYDLVPSSVVLVINPETEEEEMLDCVRVKDDYRFKGPTAQLPEPEDPFILCKTLAHKTFATGELILRPLQEKSTTILGKDSLVFIIMYGTLAVTIHKTSSVLGSEDTFYVPAGNTYRIQNLRDENAKLCYFQVKGVSS